MYNNEPFPSKKFQQAISEYLYGRKLERKNNRILEGEPTHSSERESINETMPKVRK